MTQIDALREFAEKVEAGKLDTKSPHCDFDVVLLVSAYNGSLDAAHSLHKAVLGDRWGIPIYEEEDGKFLCLLGYKQDEKVYVEEWLPIPARAWLLAIIKAKISEIE